MAGHIIGMPSDDIDFKGSITSQDLNFLKSQPANSNDDLDYHALWQVAFTWADSYDAKVHTSIHGPSPTWSWHD